MDASSTSALIACAAIIAIPVIQRVERRMSRIKAGDLAKFNPLMLSPVQFEHHCADVLRSLGWKCKTTRTSGDFGIDLIAEHSGHRVVFQVKKWSKPVNLSAVQEAVAGAALYRASRAYVVSVSGYQRSAVRLAAANNVRLLSYQELLSFTPQVSQGLAGRLRQMLPQ